MELEDGKTPREQVENFFSMSVFYYLLPLLEKEYDKIYDLGCGKNLFKPYVPRLVGIGAEPIIEQRRYLRLGKKFISWYNNVKDPSWPLITNSGDFHNLPVCIQQECVNVHKIQVPDDFSKKIFHDDIPGFFDDQYVKGHQDYYKSVFSICALHFRPINKFYKLVKDFASMIQPGGRGFLSINLIRMIERTSQKIIIDLLGTTDYNKCHWERYIHSEISKIKGVKWLIVDVDLTLLDEAMNGNVRLVFAKEPSL